MRAFLIVLALALGFGGVAIADEIPPARAGAPTVAPPGAPGVDGTLAPAVVKAPKDRDRTEGKGTGMALLFWACALGTVGGAIFVITRRNMIAAVMGMVGTFIAVAALYMMLYAHFLAVIQMLVYAGAIMVLFVFVIMVLNRPEDEPWALTGLPGKALAGLAMLYLTFRLGQTVWSVKADANALAAPAAVTVTLGKKVDPVTRAISQDTESYHWGSTGAVGKSLFHDYLFPFEAISILLLAAVVGAIAVARPWKDEDSPDDLNEDVPSEVVS